MGITYGSSGSTNPTICGEYSASDVTIDTTTYSNTVCRVNTAYDYNYTSKKYNGKNEGESASSIVDSCQYINKTPLMSNGNFKLARGTCDACTITNSDCLRLTDIPDVTTVPGNVIVNSYNFGLGREYVAAQLKEKTLESMASGTVYFTKDGKYYTLENNDTNNTSNTLSLSMNNITHRPMSIRDSVGNNSSNDYVDTTGYTSGTK